jgi:hypothetical protein
VRALGAIPFSVVIPVANRDAGLVPRTLPSWLALGADDVVIATDKPASAELRDAVIKVVRARKAARFVTVIEVPRDSAYHFHQAFVRRSGFMAAAHDAILTGDIDLLVRKRAAKAAAKVGVGGVGLVSLSKLGGVTGASSALRTVSFLVMQKLNPPKFGGLYAFWRPYWLETEDYGVRLVRDPRIKGYPEAGLGILGEDTYLYLCMKRQYTCVHDNSVSAIDVKGFVEDLPRLQYEWGRALVGTRNAVEVAFASVFLAYPNLLRGFLRQRSEKRRLVDIFSPGFRWTGSEGA